MENCFYCEKGEKLNSLMIKIIELSNSIVYLNRNQKHKGRSIVTFKGHKKEWFDLTPEENKGFFADTALVAKALNNVFKPNKINYATFGDTVPHTHIHVVPKYEGGFQWGKFFDDSEKEFLTEDQYKDLISKISAEIEKLK
ncbi:MAG: HIT family protein [Elusimicrobiota bacterium]|jgi:diadenosine tetraphosphate (Ap4A) HIT family hydrolase|nr:HIT family protein [Elusimicrobiota bacterium]